ncbi:MarR family winged helix-turn-helix transcriptional regulator [Pseudooceanicola spongiae]|uniref:MarR family transcriptional regulator n=1 Tax=Pseudooceanicola spongiae TaxID=2613965 RepID=A0A7L9WH18_9RHOB|nr:MarR family transcriptional regulator [Pseudooceanicola spongiae]QOL79519.1 MarR family transcriptional regulator [Pseudooceanicola spongiae]
MSDPINDKDAAEGEGRFRKQDWPFYWLTRTSARYFMTMEKRLKSVGLDVPRWRVLMSLFEDEHMSVSEIAEVCIIKLNTATKIIQRMVADGLVTTRARPTDARVTEVTLTPLGDARRREARAIADVVFAGAFQDLDAEEQRVLNTLMERVFHRLGDY